MKDKRYGSYESSENYQALDLEDISKVSGGNDTDERPPFIGEGGIEETDYNAKPYEGAMVYATSGSQIKKTKKK
jgi:hypothetical protein